MLPLIEKKVVFVKNRKYWTLCVYTLKKVFLVNSHYNQCNCCKCLFTVLAPNER